MNKRIIAVLMSLTVSLAYIQTFAQENSSESGDITLKEISLEKKDIKIEDKTWEYLNILHSFGIYENMTAENIDSTAKVTRAEFAQMAYELFNGNLTPGKCGYNDVNDSDSYYEAVSALTQNGILQGDENNNFNPNDEITVGQASKIAIMMLGYRYHAEIEGGYYVGYNKIAQDNRLYPGGSSDRSMNYAEAILLMYNITETDIAFVDISNRNISADSGTTFMNEYFDIYKVDDAYCESNMYSGIVGKSACSDNCVVIDGGKYSDTSNIAAKYLGYRVSFYYRDNDDDEEIVYILPHKKVTEKYILSMAVIDDSNLTSSCIPYETEKNDKKLLLDEDVTVIYNGVETSGYTADLFRNVNGSFTAVDNDSDSKTDTLIIKSYEYYIFDKIDITNNIITDKFGRILDIAPDDDEEKIIWCDADGNQYNINDLIEWDALAVEKSTDESYYKITVLNKHIEGKLTNFSGSGKEKKAVINGNEYKISDHYYQSSDNKFPVQGNIGVNVFAVLDVNDEIILFDAANSGEYKWGILIKISPYEDTDDKYFAKVIASDGLQYTYELDKKVAIDGKKYSSKTATGYTAMISALQDGDVLSYLSQEEKAENPGYEIPADFVYQLIRYEISKDGKIKAIDTTAKNSDNPVQELTQLTASKINTRISRGVSMAYKSNDSTFNKIIKANASTMVFCVPSPISYSDESAYIVESYKYFQNDKSETMIPYGISFEDTMGIKAIVMIDSFKSNLSNSDIVMYDEAEYVLSSDDEPVVSIKTWHGKTSETLLCGIEAYEEVSLNMGDLFKYQKDAKGIINKIEKVFDVKEEKVLDSGGTDISNPNASLRYLYADVYDKSDLGVMKMSSVYENGAFSVVNPVTISKNSLLELHTFGLYNAWKGIAVYNEDNKEIRTGTYDDIKTYKTFTSNCSKVLLITQYQEARYLYIYNLRKDD